MQPLKSTYGAREKQCKTDRLKYLEQLVIEFETSKSKDAKEQVLANLANFAYDPLNYNYFRILKILDLFLDNLSHSDVNLIKFSVAALCNLCLDPINKEYIFKNGLTKLIELLNHKNEDIMLSVITIFMFLITPNSKEEIIKEDIIKSMLKLSKSDNIRIKNLATIFLEDYCSKKLIETATSSVSSSVHVVVKTVGIPLPDS